MATITSAGIGSGLDVNAIVSQLVAAERQAPARRLSAEQSKTQTQISALGTFRSALAQLQDAAKVLRDGGVAKLAATSTNTALLTATATDAAAAGSYTVEVVQLAAAHKLGSAAYAASSTAIGTGNLTLSVGGTAFTVSIDSTSNTLAGIRDAINAASNNSGVRASLLNTAAGVRLTLTAANTGVAGSITVSQAGGDGGLAALAYNPILPSGLSVIDPAQDAKIRIDGYDFASSTNVFSNAVSGVSFNAVKAELGTRFQVGVALDRNATQAAATSFVNSYNLLNATVATLSRYDATTKQAGPLLGDATLRGLSQQVRAAVTGALPSGSYSNLSQVGISVSTDGSLKLDATKFNAALDTDAKSVATLFGSNGYGGKLFTLADAYLVSDGRIKASQDAALSRLTSIQKQQDSLDLRLRSVESRYRAQFTALDTLMSQLRNTSDYLTKQLAKLP